MKKIIYSIILFMIITLASAQAADWVQRYNFSGVTAYDLSSSGQMIGFTSDSTKAYLHADHSTVPEWRRIAKYDIGSNSRDWYVQGFIESTDFHSLDLSADDLVIARGLDIPEVQIHNASNGEVIHNITDLSGVRVGSVDFSPDNKWLAVGTGDQVAIYDTATWTKNRTIGTSGFVYYVSFSEGSDMLSYSAQFTGTFVYNSTSPNPGSWNQIRSLGGSYTDGKFALNDQLLFLGQYSGTTLNVYNTTDWSLYYNNPTYFPGSYQHIVVNNQFMAGYSVGANNLVISTLEGVVGEIVLDDGSGFTYSARFSPDNKWLLVGKGSNTYILYDISLGDDVECFDGIDNDGDNLTDYPNDPGCTSILDTIEGTFQCNDGIDNDGDGKIDFPADSGCTSERDNTEASGGGGGGGSCGDNQCTAPYEDEINCPEDCALPVEELPVEEPPTFSFFEGEKFNLVAIIRELFELLRIKAQETLQNPTAVLVLIMGITGAVLIARNNNLSKKKKGKGRKKR